MASANLNHPLPNEESLQFVDGEIKGLLPARRVPRSKDVVALSHQQSEDSRSTTDASGNSPSPQVEKRPALKGKRGKRQLEKSLRQHVHSNGDAEEVGGGGYGDFSEDVALIKKDLVSTLDAEQAPYTVNHVVSSLIAMLQGVEVLCSLAILYLYKDDFQMDPALMTVVQGALRIPWTIKPVWALMSDGMPLFGYRRKSYILIGSLLCLSSTLCMGLFGYMWMWTTTLLLFFYFLGSALCNVIGEALVVEAGRTDASEDGAAKTVSTFFAFRKLSFAVMSYLSGFLLEVMPKQHLFLVASVLPAGVFLACWFLSEPKIEHRPIGMQVKRLIDVVKQPTLLNSMFFIFLMMCTPSAGAVMFYFMTNELKFGPELLGRMALFQSVASLLGILTYMWLFSKTCIRSLLLWSTVIITPFCLLPVIVVERWNLQMGIPDSAFVVTDTVLMEFVGEFQSMPILVLAARLCPPGLESTIYSVLLSAYNLGLGIGSIVSAGMTSLFGITSTSFNNLSIFISLCAVTNFIPLTLLWLIPSDAIDTAALVSPYGAVGRSPSSTETEGDEDDETSAARRRDSDETRGVDGGTTEHSTTDSDKEMGIGCKNYGSGGETDSSSGGGGGRSSRERNTRRPMSDGGHEAYHLALGTTTMNAERRRTMMMVVDGEGVRSGGGMVLPTSLSRESSFSPITVPAEGGDHLRGRIVCRQGVGGGGGIALGQTNGDLALPVALDNREGRGPFFAGGRENNGSSRRSSVATTGTVDVDDGAPEGAGLGGGGSGECCGRLSAP